MEENKTKQNRTSKFIRVLILNITFVLFGLCAVASGTYAWFAAGRSASVEAGAFTIAAPEGVSYTLYYLDYFCNNSGAKTFDGNFDASVNLNCGYELERDLAQFTHVDFDSEGEATAIPVVDPSTHETIGSWKPTEIKDLWPAHQLTFALIIDGGSFAGFNLSSWGEKTVQSPAMAAPLGESGENVNVSISWAINIYGYAYHLTPSSEGTVAGGIGAAYAQYHADRIAEVEDPESADPQNPDMIPFLQDRFPYSQESPAAEQHSTLNIIRSSEIKDIPVTSSSSQQTIAFFTLEFSDAAETFYSKDANGIYHLDPTGNSNCYEGLGLENLEFALL